MESTLMGASSFLMVPCTLPLVPFPFSLCVPVLSNCFSVSKVPCISVLPSLTQCGEKEECSLMQERTVLLFQDFKILVIHPFL